MTEKEMIEEMAKDLKECLPNNWYWQKSVDSDTYFVAKHFHNAGYRKILKGSVVLSKEEYQELEELRLNHAKDLINANKLYEERIADLKIEFSNHIKNLERKIDRRDRDLNSQADRLINLKEELSQARKETTQEIIKFVSEHCDNESLIWLLDEFAKKYGVEE